jgi:hypothetical protein
MAMTEQQKIDRDIRDLVKRTNIAAVVAMLLAESERRLQPFLTGRVGLAEDWPAEREYWTLYRDALAACMGQLGDDAAVWKAAWEQHDEQ